MRKVTIPGGPSLSLKRVLLVRRVVVPFVAAGAMWLPLRRYRCLQRQVPAAVRLPLRKSVACLAKLLVTIVAIIKLQHQELCSQKGGSGGLAQYGRWEV